MDSRVSSLSLVLPVSATPFSPSLSFLFFSLSLSFSRPFLFVPPLLFLSYSALGSRNSSISRSRFRGSTPFFSPSDLYARPSLRQPRPCFVLYARAFPASPVLRSDRLRIQREIDRPKCVPERPERTRRECGGKGCMRRFKGMPQEKDATVARA